MIKIYNSLTNQIEEFKPIKPNEVSMYVCGSTVYNDMHIGNARPVVFFDTVARFFKYIGYDVKLVSNFTDIDDKIIKRALEEKVSEKEISERYIASILKTYQKANCLPHYKNPKVTETMPQIIEFVNQLINKDGAYEVDGDVYFDVSKAKDYGILSKQDQEKLIVGARIDENVKKHNANDFNLWKTTTTGIKWDSPWGCGRPGWHTECVVMINDIFHSKIDIHGGGTDLKFPHHDNEIAQASVAYNHQIANYWVHNGRLNFNGEKMSKSLGNSISANEMLDEIGFGNFRTFILSTPYRQPLNYRDDILKQACTDYSKIKNAKISLMRKLQISFNITNFDQKIVNEELLQLKNEFISAMNSDFNTPNAITTIFKVTKLINNYVRQKENDANYGAELLTLLNEMMWVLGIDEVVNVLNDKELQLVLKWQHARDEKNFTLADQYRQEMANQGIVV